MSRKARDLFFMEQQAVTVVHSCVCFFPGIPKMDFDVPLGFALKPTWEPSPKKASIFHKLIFDSQMRPGQLKGQ